MNVRNMWCVLVLSVGAAAVGVAQDFNSSCLGDVGANSCTANDVFISELHADSIITPCAGEGSTGVANLRVHVHGANPTRYDIGIYVATDGGPVNHTGNNCYHTFLPTPFTTALPPNAPWGDWDSDGVPDIYRAFGGTTAFWEETGGATNQCGDIPGGTNEAIYVFGPVTFTCTDTNANGLADLELGTSWETNAGFPCSGVGQAIPSDPSKCNGVRVDFAEMTIPVELQALSVE